MIKKIILIIIGSYIATLGFTYSYNNNDIKILKKQVNELMQFKTDIKNIEELYLKLSGMLGGLLLIFSFFGTKQIINIKKSLKEAKNKLDDINTIDNISSFRFMIDDYFKIMQKEGNTTKEESYTLQVKAKKNIYKYEKLKKEGIFEKYPLDSYHLSVVADAYFELGNYEKAKSLFDEAYIHDNDNSRANYGIAFSLEELAESKGNLKLYLKERITHLILATKLEPFNIVYLADLGFAYIVNEDYEKATYCFTKSYNIDKLRFVKYFKESINPLNRNEYDEKYLNTETGKKILELIKQTNNVVNFEYLQS